MKFLGSLLATFTAERDLRRNLKALGKYLAFLALVMLAHTVVFHILMAVEGQEHSWFSGFYWTVVVMSTLGFGDIAFQSDAGRLFSVVVLLSGVILLLIVLPFVFIRSFYAPWLEARLRLTAPRSVPDEMEGHVLITGMDSIVPGLIRRLDQAEIPYRVLEGDPVRAAQLSREGVSVLAGEVDEADTYRRGGVTRARMVVANRDDATNTNITLTVREVAPQVPVVAFCESEDSVDILHLSGADHVLPLKRQLGEQLAQRVNAGYSQVHPIGSYRELVIAEFPVHNTPLAGLTIRESRLREIAGVNVVGVWEKARLLPAHPDLILQDLSLLVVVGTKAMMDDLDEYLCIYDVNYNPVLVIGGGKVGRSAARALKRRGIPVHLIEKDERLRPRLEGLPDRLIIGDAARREVLDEAGLSEAPSVLLTTNDDGVNLYLCIYCRRLNPEVRIVSRITFERNVPSIQRAGADLALSYAELGMESIISLIRNREVVILGEGVELRALPVPPPLTGKTLSESGIGAASGVNVIAVEDPEGNVLHADGRTVLQPGHQLVVISTVDQIRRFREAFL